MSISKKMIWIMSSLVSLFVIIITVYYYNVSAKMIRMNAERQIINTLNQAVHNLDANISAVEGILYDMSTSVSLQKLLQEAEKTEDKNHYSTWQVSEEIRNVLMVESTKLSAIQGFYVYDTKGREYSVRNLRYDYSTEEIRKEVIEKAKGKTVWGKKQQGKALFGEGAAPMVIPVGKAIYSLADHKILGYMIAFVETEYLQSVVDDILFTEEDVIFLMDQNGNVLGDEVSQTAKEMPYQSGKIVSEEYEGNMKRITAWPTESGIWNLMMITADEAKNQELMNFQRTTVLLLFSAGGFAIILSILLARSISKPILNLVEDMQRFSKGDFSIQVSVRYNDEIGILRRNFNKLVTDINELVQDITNEKMLKQQAQLRMLQLQINPHFLYNTLDTINWLAQDYGAEDIAEVSRSLGYLMHFSLAEQELISFEEEMDAVEHYMRIQQYRYGKSLHADIQVEEEVLYEKTPRHVLLPLIENAVEHGLKNKVGEKKIQIFGSVKDQIVEIQILDNGVGMSKKAIEKVLKKRGEGNNSGIENGEENSGHMSIGIQNVNRRIQLRYGDEYGLQIQSELGKGTLIVVHIPC